MLINCYAKINIGLEILNKRTDNYHNINTIFYKINLCDELTIVNNDTFDFIFNSALKIPDIENLAYKAAMAVKDELKLSELNVRITLNKRIPSGAGLGGGSADAAGLLKGLTDFLDADISNNRLKEIGLSLGSDVPFFLGDSNAAIGRARGEELNNIDFELPYYILLIFPDINVSTAEAYKSLNRSNDAIEVTDYSRILNMVIEKPEQMNNYFVNHFEEAVFHQHPALKEIKRKLKEGDAFYASMSGSGSTIYGLFINQNDAEKAKSEFAEYKSYLHHPFKSK